MAHYDLGVALQQASRIPEAISQYEEALKLSLVSPKPSKPGACVFLPSRGAARPAGVGLFGFLLLFGFFLGLGRSRIDMASYNAFAVDFVVENANFVVKFEIGGGSGGFLLLGEEHAVWGRLEANGGSFPCS